VIACQVRELGVGRDLHDPIEDLDFIIGENNAEDRLVRAVKALLDESGVAAGSVAKPDRDLVALARVAHAEGHIHARVFGEEVLGIKLALK
jgi:hypothetical protein